MLINHNILIMPIYSIIATTKTQSNKDAAIDIISEFDIIQDFHANNIIESSINNTEPMNYDMSDIINQPFDVDKPLVSRRKNPKTQNAVAYKELLIHSHIQANHGRAFKIHVIMIYDIEQKNMMRAMSIADYQKNFKTILRENPSSITISEIEVMPGKSYPSMKVAIKDGVALVDCLIFCLLMDKDVPGTNDQEFIASSNILRKVIVGNEQKINLIINRIGAFIKTK